MKTSYLLYGFLALAIGLWLLQSLGGDDEALIEGQIAELQRLVGKSADETVLEATDRALDTVDLLTTEFEIRLDPVGAKIEETAGLSRSFVGLRRRAQSLHLGIGSLEIEVLEGSRLATSTFTAQVTGTVDGVPRQAAYPVTIRWREERGSWRMAEIHVGHEIEGGLF